MGRRGAGRTNSGVHYGSGIGNGSDSPVQCVPVLETSRDGSRSDTSTGCPSRLGPYIPRPGPHVKHPSRWFSLSLPRGRYGRDPRAGTTAKLDGQVLLQLWVPRSRTELTRSSGSSCVPFEGRSCRRASGIRPRLWAYVAISTAFRSSSLA